MRSPSPVSSISQISSLPPTSSPILPHIPHLNKSRFSMPPPASPSTPRDSQSRHSMPIMDQSASLPTSGNQSPSNHSVTLNTDNESCLTTPDTPLGMAYCQLVESPDVPRPEDRKPRPYHPYENIGAIHASNPVSTLKTM